MISRCYHCQIATNEPKQEPVKPSSIPDTEWHTVSTDFGGPYPDGHYNLVLIDKRTRYPVVEQTRSTSAKVTCEKLRGIFATHGVPERLESDNGPPFNSHEFKEFAGEMGFYHHRVTPEHPRANGEAESFMKVLNKTEKIARTEKKSSFTAIQNMLMGYRSTPHPATGFPPYEALMKRSVRTILDRVPNQKPKLKSMDKHINQRDAEYKKRRNDQRRYPVTKSYKYQVGDKVLVKAYVGNKWSSAYEHEPNKIIDINGSSITVRRPSDGRIRVRDAAKYKPFREEKVESWKDKLFRTPAQNENCETTLNNDNRRQFSPQETTDEIISNESETEQLQAENQPQTTRSSNRRRRFPSWKFKDFVLRK